jgi:hypothetical protein
MPVPPATVSGNAPNAVGYFLWFEDPLPVVLHQRGLAELHCLVTGIGERTFALLEDDGSEHVDVAEEEVERRLAPRRTTSSTPSRMMSSSEAHMVSASAGSSMASCSTVTRCERITGAQIVLAIASPLA